MPIVPQDMQVGDKINKMYVVDGLEFLNRPKQVVAETPPDSAEAPGSTET